MTRTGKALAIGVLTIGGLAISGAPALAAGSHALVSPSENHGSSVGTSENHGSSVGAEENHGSSNGTDGENHGSAPPRG